MGYIFFFSIFIHCTSSTDSFSTHIFFFFNILKICIQFLKPWSSNVYKIKLILAQMLPRSYSFKLLHTKSVIFKCICKVLNVSYSQYGKVRSNLEGWSSIIVDQKTPLISLKGTGILFKAIFGQFHIAQLCKKYKFLCFSKEEFHLFFTILSLPVDMNSPQGCNFYY